MEFASKYILHQDDDDYECVSDEEFNDGMSVSDSDSGEESLSAVAPQPALPESVQMSSPFQMSSAVQMSAVQMASAVHSPRKKKVQKKKQRHWKSFLPFFSGKPDKDDEKSISSNYSNRWFRRADTNVVSVNFDTLLSPGNMHAGEATICAQCGAILSSISKLDVKDDTSWCCEFCGTSVVVDVEDEEIPKTEDVTYLMEPAISTSSRTMSGMDQSLVIFVMDTSGSMCVTTEVEGKIKLRGSSHLQRLQSFNDRNEDQYLPSQRCRDVTYISRLQAMQAAVDHQLEEMAKQHSNRRVALIAFSSEVTVIGDGTQIEVTLAGDKLTNEEQLRKEALEIALPQEIQSSRSMLGKKVYKLEEGGATALGPALTVAVSMASHHPGSKVILCTDGKANIGLGKLEETQDEVMATQFYVDVGGRALNAGVAISVITIQGTDCKLVHLGQLADKTGGQVNIVDPLKLREEFSNILADSIIATKVKATFILYKDLYVVDEADPDNQACRAEQQVGNVTHSSTITFQFARRKNSTTPTSAAKSAKKDDAGTSSKAQPETSQAAARETPETKQLRDLPFQLQIEYVDTEGNKALRVITRSMPATTDRELAEQNANLDILGTHTAKTSADLVLKGKYTQSRGIALMNQRLAWRHSRSEVAPVQAKAQYKNIYCKIKSMENHIQKMQRKEYMTSGHTRSDSEDSSEDCDIAASLAKHTNKATTKGQIAKKFRKMHQSRNSEMDDSMANMVYQFHSVGKGAISTPVLMALEPSSKVGDDQAASSPSSKVEDDQAASSPSSKVEDDQAASSP